MCVQTGDSEDIDTQPPQMTNLSAFHALLQAAHGAAEAQRVEAAQCCCAGVLSTSYIEVQVCESGEGT